MPRTPATQNKRPAVRKDPPGLLTTAEAADYLFVSERLLWQLTKDGKIPRVLIGRAVRYHRPDLDAWIEANKSRGPA